MNINDSLKYWAEDKEKSIWLSQDVSESSWKEINRKIEKRRKWYDKAAVIFRKKNCNFYLRIAIQTVVVLLFLVFAPTIIRNTEEYLGDKFEESRPNQGAESKAVRLSEKDAIIVLTEYFKDNKLNLPPAINNGLEEITSDDIFNRLGIQVFKLDYETYVIKESEVYHIATGFGGMGVEAVFVADLNNDNILELVYSFSYGSGIHRTQIGALIFEKEPVEVVADYAYFDGILSLEKVSDQEILFTDEEGEKSLALHKDQGEYILVIKSK